MTKTKAFGIFEGGGAKGLAHAGALKAAEDRFEFIGVAGTSAGAIVAALIAAGYRADDIYSPGNLKSILNKNLTDLLDPKEWQSLKALRDRFAREKGDNRSKRLNWPRLTVRLVAIGMLLTSLVCIGIALLGFQWMWMPGIGTAVFSLPVFLSGTIARVLERLLQITVWWIRIHIYAIQYIRPLLSIGSRGGVMTTHLFEKWLNERLREKLAETDPSFANGGGKETVTFADLPIHLKIIAADSRQKKIKVFQSQTDSAVSVAAAVCASISIPLAFAPKSLRESLYVDGGIMSNFPAWVFDAEREESPRFTPTIGFRLVEQTESQSVNDETFDIFKHLKDVGLSAIFGDNTLETRNVARLSELMIGVKIGVLDFDVKDKDAVYDSAFRQAQDRLAGLVFRVSDERMEQILKMVDASIRKELQHQGHLRINVMLPIDNARLQVAYSYNMSGVQDTDDRLILGRHQGAAGTCWRDLEAIACNLEEAQLTYADVWQMDKYQQCLVRKSLKSLLSVPLFLPNAVSREEGFVGVLNFDSDEQLFESFKKLGENDEDGNLLLCTQMIAERLTNWRLI
jgi:NTE family protein